MIERDGNYEMFVYLFQTRFIGVSLVDLFVNPTNMRDKASSSFPTSNTLKFCKLMDPPSFSLKVTFGHSSIGRFLCCWFRRS